MKTNRLIKDALLTTIALIIFVIETQIPNLVPIPGVKLGLANIVTVYAMFALGPVDALCILLCRITLGSIFAGQMMSFFYSLSGGLMCYLAMLVLRKVFSEKQIWICSVIGAVFHNIGQIIIAIIVSGTIYIMSYLPVLLISGIITGCFTGICAQTLIGHLKKIGKK